MTATSTMSSRLQDDLGHRGQGPRRGERPEPGRVPRPVPLRQVRCGKAPARRWRGRRPRWPGTARSGGGTSFHGQARLAGKPERLSDRFPAARARRRARAAHRPATVLRGRGLRGRRLRGVARLTGNLGADVPGSRAGWAGRGGEYRPLVERRRGRCGGRPAGSAGGAIPRDAPGWSSGGWVTGPGSGTGRDRAAELPVARAGPPAYPAGLGSRGRTPGCGGSRAGPAQRSAPGRGSGLGGQGPVAGGPSWGWAGTGPRDERGRGWWRPGPVRPGAGAGPAARRRRRRVRRSQSQAARLAGRYGSDQSGASSAARPTATATITWRPEPWAGDPVDDGTVGTCS